MNKKNIIFISCAAIILILFVSSYLFFQSKASNKNETVCKKNTKSTETQSSKTLSPSTSQVTSTEISSTGSSSKGSVNTIGNTSCNILNGGYAAQQGNWVYFNCKGLYKAMLDMKTGWKKVSDDADPLDINVIGNNVYYTYMNNLYRVSTNGENKTKLSNDSIRNLVATSNDLYYINNEDNKIYKMNLITNSTAALSDGFCSRFTLDKDWIYYSRFSPEDQNSMVYKMKLDASNITKLIPTISDYIIPHNEFLYFLEYNKDNATIFRSKFNSPNKEKLYDNANFNLNFIGDFLLCIDQSNTLRKINTNNLNENIAMDLNKHGVFNYSNIMVIENHILLFNPVKGDIYKINNNGTIEQIAKYK